MNDIKKNNQSWAYSQKVKAHFINPQNFVEEDVPDWKFDGFGEIGSPACGDVMKMWIKIRNGKIIQCGWKTFGCASAIASTSVLSEMLMKDGGMILAEAKKITAKQIVDELGGLPDNKIHCSVLGDQALRLAINDYEQRSKNAV
jgi:NifU-like protein involved in Fe-S cluster formation